MIGLWSVAPREELRHALVVEDVRRVERWTARYRLATVIWPAKPFDPFFNANARDDIARRKDWRSWTEAKISRLIIPGCARGR